MMGGMGAKAFASENSGFWWIFDKPSMCQKLKPIQDVVLWDNRRPEPSQMVEQGMSVSHNSGCHLKYVFS